jgi:flagellar protein FlgJ
MQVSPLSLNPKLPSEREQLHKAAQQFEAIFVRQMLSSARQAGFGNELFSSQGTQTFQAMQDEKFAEVASQRGAFGFAKVIEAQLSRHLDAQPAKEG